MESRREKSSSGEIFSFPSTPVQDQDSDFEFGSITPDSPSTFNNSPADHLFVNGRLLPHSFPPQPIGVYTVDVSRQTSRTSSVGSKDSFMSSRSNSTNSRSSSSCGSSTSARTSSSDNNNNNVDIRSSRFSSYQKKSQKSSVSAQVYGSSQRWQFIASVSVPVTLSRENSRRKKSVEKIGGKSDLRRKKRRTEKTSTARKKKKKKKKKNMWFGRKVFRWIILVCKECHAIEPSRKDEVVRKDEIVRKTKSTTTKPKS
ncbi:probable membrane-associated kinase regulator 1 [Benincasa hispida]|uniref:probable membrane-associated kinase regulator 1 n=1 Tax=Benincasa hispida TaxID=102211 RepID=UPI0019029317|nr:probable membrane-associated kinase regulator 1 [Benincasa hispida]